MSTVITESPKKAEVLPRIFSEILPPKLYLAIEAAASRGTPIEEIRLRTGRRASVTSQGRNLIMDVVLSCDDMERIVSRICDGSIYAHADTINKGYITLSGGIRVGVVGRAATEGGRVLGVYDVSALCFRLPRKVCRVGTPVARLMRELNFESGVLVYSPPGEGKTTLLRGVIRELAAGMSPWRVLVIDSREELGFSLEDSALTVDVLSGYPRALGIEIAARSMNAQLIVCDEIGDVSEAQAIVAAQNCGVPLLATAHGATVEGLLRRTGIRTLHDAHVFGAYVGIRRQAGERDYRYTFTYYGEADAILQNSGGGDSRP